MTVADVVDWLLRLGDEHGVDPVLYAAIWLGALPLFFLSVGWLVRTIRRRGPLMPPLIATALFFSAPTLYVFAVGRALPAWVYLLLLGLALVGVAGTVRDVRRRTANDAAPPLDPGLRERLRAVELDPDRLSDPGEAWRRLRERFGARVTLVDRYALEAAVRGIGIDELDRATRDRLGAEVVRVQFPDLEYTSGSERRDEPIEVVPYDDAWPERFAAWRDRLRSALGDLDVRIEHVGSTAVKRLPAKPIVDIQINVPDIEDEPAYVPPIEGAGLRLRAREAGHRYFRPPADRPREVHVHVCEIGSAWERDHLLFRDYLRAHPAVRDAYAVLKRDLVGRHAADRLAYTDAKSVFILDVLDEAADWATRTGWRVA